MSKLLVVFGATGNQGGSVIDMVLKHPELSKQFKIRGLTRDASKPAAQQLQSQGVEMVNLNIDDPVSIESCLRGAHTVFILSLTDYNANTRDYEYNQGKTVADIAVKAEAKYLIYSTLPSIRKNSEGRLRNAWQFDVKAEIEDYIRSLPIKSAFFSPGSFMQNTHTIYKPRKDKNDVYIIPSIEPSDTQHMPLIDIGDTGKYIGAILLKPDEYEGKVFYGAVGLYSWEEIAGALSKATGKNVQHKLIGEPYFRGVLPPNRADELVDMMHNRSRLGYYDRGQREHIEWSNKQAIGQPTNLEEYLKAHPLEI